MGERIAIHLELFLTFRGQSMWRGAEEVPVGATVHQLLQQLALGEGELAVLVNGRRAEPEQVLHRGDQVAVLRQAEGGD